MQGWLGRLTWIRLAQLATIVGLSAVGFLPVQLYGQEFDKVGHLFFSKPSGGADPLPQIVTVTADSSAIEFAASAHTSSGGDWLSVSAAQECCVSPTALSVMVKPSSTLAAGNYTGQVVLTGDHSSLVVEVDLIVTPEGAPAFDKTPSQLGFSMTPGGSATPQMMQISGVGHEALQWRLIGAPSFLSVSTQTGTAPTRITVGVLPEKLPNEGATPGVYTGQLLFLSAGSTVTVPVRVAVGDKELVPGRKFKTNGLAGGPSASSNPTTTPNPNLWPANTANCFCGGFGNQDTGYGILTTAPDGTTSSKLVTEANPGSGTIPHYEYLYMDLGAGQQTLSFHLKAQNDSWAYITSKVDGVFYSAWFNLGNGTVGTIPSGWTAQVTAVGNGWYRCAVTFTASSSAVFNGFGLATADQQYAYTATNGNGVFEWGQQAQHGTLTAYQGTDAPCLSPNVQRDAGVVNAGSPIGFEISVLNEATPTLATTLNAPLPAGAGINWSISPGASWPVTCSITGSAGSQTLVCPSSNLAAWCGGRTAHHHRHHSDDLRGI